MAWRKINDNVLTGIADAIRTKTGSSDSYTPQQMPDAIAGIETGGGSASSVSKKDVNFYDYDGTLLHSYTLSEAAALTELPPLPEQPGLICQEWNWSLADIKAMGRAVDVGATYITDDGKTRLYISIDAPGRMDIPLMFTQTISNGVTVDWGDGSNDETFDGMQIETHHSYTNIGNYIITMDVANGCELSLGNEESGINMFLREEFDVYSNMLRKVEIGARTQISCYAFSCCYGLSDIVIPNGVPCISEGAFDCCYNLTSIVLSKSVDSIDSMAFNGCHGLSIVVMSNNLTNIGDSVFSDCYGLLNAVMPNSVTNIEQGAFVICNCIPSIIIPNGIDRLNWGIFEQCSGSSIVVIPESVSYIDQYVFSWCSSVSEYHLYPNTPPVLTNANAFDRMPSDCIIYVPVGSLNAYKTATNWSTYASKMREEGT